MASILLEGSKGAIASGIRCGLDGSVVDFLLMDCASSISHIFPRFKETDYTRVPSGS